jgi:hypothetical protein
VTSCVIARVVSMVLQRVTFASVYYALARAHGKDIARREVVFCWCDGVFGVSVSFVGRGGSQR